VIGGLGDMLDKLWYNCQVYEWAVQARDIGTNQGFAILDYAQAACAMHAWACKVLTATGRSACIASLSDIPWSGALRAVANNSKHASVSDKEWPGGFHFLDFVAEPEAREALQENLANLEQGIPRLMQTIGEGSIWGEGRFVDPDRPEGVPAQKVLLESYQGWSKALTELGLV
jgi:hypothetical protein